MFKPMALAHSLAVLVAGFFVVLYALETTSPALFALIFNAQFYGADIARLVPAMFFSDWIIITIVSALTAWVAGYAMGVALQLFRKEVILGIR